MSGPYRPPWYPADGPAPFTSNGQTGSAEASLYAEWLRKIPDVPGLIEAWRRGDLFCQQCGNFAPEDFDAEDRCRCGNQGLRRTDAPEPSPVIKSPLARPGSSQLFS